MEKTKLIALFIGRFQPFHNGHLFAIRWVASRSKKVIIAIGSANKAFEPENPFTAMERKKMIEAQLKASGIKRCKIVKVTDIDDDSRWVEHVDRSVPKYDVVYSNNPLVRKLMKKAGKRIYRIPFFKKEKYNATKIRQRIKKRLLWEDRVPEKVREALKRIQADERIKSI